ncbi:VanZ family protein [Paenibacillus pinisoli]|uniref:VanZ family protein n=1 Tax=Paenibacillus pinisoli TaxID=1276110 RepID=A0A3A6PUM8_9BACL|nr:VanZ family protein [Paenibacillus pinisoli]RJX40471.1 VanZ family protein [Paenibacillus pinisoli]
MSFYAQPLLVAVLFFLLLGMLLFVPWLIYSYRKYGFFSFWATLVVFSFIYYMISALFLVLLPLPSSYDTCAQQAPGTVYYSLMPFTFITDMLQDGTVQWTQPGTYPQILKQKAFWQAAFNVLLLVPFGVYLRYFFREKRHWRRALGLGFLLSLFYEVTQLTGIYGLYKCPYRLFDVDDLMLNSMGALIGYFGAPIVLALFPSRESLQAKKESFEEKRHAAPVAQLLALLVDYVIIRLSHSLTTGIVTANAFAEAAHVTIGFLIMFGVVPYFLKGKTVGTSLLRLRVADREGQPPAMRALLKRTLALYVPWLLSGILGALTDMTLPYGSPFYGYGVWLQIALFLLSAAMWAVLFVHALIVILHRGQRSFYFDYCADLRCVKR